MPVTILDPKTALVIIDLQKGILAFPVAHPTADIVARASGLAAAFRRHKLPVVLVNVAGMAPGRTEQPRRNLPFSPDFAELLPELNQQAGDIVATKRTPGVFASTDLEAQLRGLGVTQVVVCGISTTSGVESSVRQAFEAGFNVTVATDAMTDTSAEAHDFAVTKTFPRMSETGTSAEIIALLDGMRG